MYAFEDLEKSLLKREAVKKRLETLEKRSKLRMANVHLPESWIYYMEILVLEERFANRAELMRYAIKKVLDEEVILSYMKKFVV